MNHPDTPQTTPCPICFSIQGERCLVPSDETCPQPWRPKGPRPALSTMEAAPSQRHADDVAINSFAHAMVDKMARSRMKGRGGWQNCSTEDLWRMLREHVEKGDPVDVANFAMMIHANQQRVSKP